MKTLKNTPKVVFVIGMTMITLSAPLAMAHSDKKDSHHHSKSTDETSATTALTAGTISYEIKGMHCGGCRDSVKKKVCALPGIENCVVELVEGKENTGKVSYTVKAGESLSEKQLAEAVSSAGKKYELDTQSKTVTKESK